MAWDTSTRRQRLPPDWQRRRLAVLRRDSYRCYLCVAPANEVDHIRPGDDHTLTNLAAICTRCHGSKSSSEGRAASRHRFSRRRATEPHPGDLTA